MKPYLCIEPQCPTSCEGCNYAVPPDDIARQLIARLLCTFALTHDRQPFADGANPLVDRARDFLRNPGPRLWIVEFGAVGLPLGNPSRLTTFEARDSENDALAVAAKSEFNCRVFSVFVPPDAAAIPVNEGKAGDDGGKGCSVDPVSSAMCERGTKGCNVAHGVKEPHPPSRKCGCADCAPSFTDGVRAVRELSAEEAVALVRERANAGYGYGPKGSRDEFDRCHSLSPLQLATTINAALAHGGTEAVIVQCTGCGEGVVPGSGNCRRKRGVNPPGDCAAGVTGTPARRETRPADPSEPEAKIARREGYDEGWNDCLSALGAPEPAPIAWVPIHPRNGPLWSMTTDNPSPERLPSSYPLRPLVFAAGIPTLDNPTFSASSTGGVES